MIDWLRDMAANLVADLILVAAGLGIGFGFFGRFSDWYVNAKVHSTLEWESSDDDEDGVQVRVANLSNEPIYHVNVVFDFNRPGSAFDDPALLSMWEEDVDAGKTAYAGGGMVTPDRVLHAVHFDYRTIRGIWHRRQLWPITTRGSRR